MRPTLLTKLQTPFSLLNIIRLPKEVYLSAMDSTLNNEEDDEMIHCPGPSGSFASSEEFTGIDNDIVSFHPEILASGS